MTLHLFTFLFWSFTSFAGTATCYIGTAKVESISSKSAGSIQVVGLAEGFEPTENDPKSYAMQPKRSYSIRFQKRRGQTVSKSSEIRFACTQTFAKRGPSDRDCIVLKEDEYQLSKEEKQKFCSIPFIE